MKYVLITNGHLANIVSPVEDFLADNGIHVETIRHPLFSTESRRAHYSLVEGQQRVIHEAKSFLKAPLSHLFDPFWGAHRIKGDVALSFSCHTTVTALFLRKIGRVKRVVHWSIDFSPRRFRSSLLNIVYCFLDRFVIQRTDLHVELTQRAAKARQQRYGLKSSAAQVIIPVGVNSKLSPQSSSERFNSQRIVFLGNLNPDQGVDTLIRSMPLVRQQIPRAVLEIVGGGDLLEKFKDLKNQLQLGQSVVFLGQLSPDEFRERLCVSTVGVAPYVDDKETFSVYGDPSKVKSYIECGLPVVMTNVPEVATELEENGCALLCKSNEQSIADALIQILSGIEEWERMSMSVSAYAQKIDWNIILRPILEKCGD